MDLKLGLARRLLQQKFARSTIWGIFYFIRNYVNFANPENERKFDDTIDSITQKGKNMGIIELMKERESVKLLQKGKEEKSTNVVKNLILKFGFNDQQAARAAEVPVAFVKKVRASLTKKK